MKKLIVYLSITLFVVFCFCSCFTTSAVKGLFSKPNDENDSTIIKTIGNPVKYVPIMGSYEDDLISITATSAPLNSSQPTSASYIVLSIMNKRTSLISLDLDKSAYISLNMVSNRVLDGEARKINSNLPQATIPITPGGITTRDLFTNDSSIRNVESSLYITINVDGQDVGYSIDLKPLKLSSFPIGSVSKEGNFITTTHLDNIANNEEIIQNRIQEEAKTQYGPNVQVINIQYRLFTTEKAKYGTLTKHYSVTADVVRWE